MRIFLVLLLTMLLTSCGFHLQGPMPLAPPLKKLYLKAQDPYGQLARNLKDYLRMSGVTLVSSPSEATAILAITSQDASQHFLSVNGTEQTRQYNLVVSVTYEITTPTGELLAGPESLSESKPITIQSNQILGSSNEANLYYNHMRRALAYAMMNRISSADITKRIEETLHQSSHPAKPSRLTGKQS